MLGILSKELSLTIVVKLREGGIRERKGVGEVGAVLPCEATSVDLLTEVQKNKLDGIWVSWGSVN